MKNMFAIRVLTVLIILPILLWETPLRAEEGVLFTPEEKAWLESHPTVRVVLDNSWAPIEFRDEDGNYNGISVDYLRRFEEILSIKLEVVPDVSWDDGVDLLRDKKADMFFSMARTKEREAFALFTEPYTSMSFKIFSRHGISLVGGLNNLADKKVAVAQGYQLNEKIKRDYPTIRQVHIGSLSKVMEMLSSGEIDAFIGNEVTASYFLVKNHFTDIRIAGETPYKYHQRLAVRDDWPIFIDILQKAQRGIDQAESDSFYNRWMSIRYDVHADYTLLWQIVALALLGFTLFFYWNRRLSHEVIQRKKAQEQAEEATLLKDKFVSLVAHDLRSPLGGIKGLAEFMLMDTRSPLGDNARSSMELIFDQIKQLLDLLESLLDLSRFQTGNIQIETRFFDAHYLADDILNRLRHQADPKGISLINDIPLRTRIHADEKLLGQVLQNLVSNAIKFSHPNEQVRVYVPDDLPATIAVIDSGVGIPHDVIEKLFQLEEQTSTPGTAGESGTGFGLPLSRQIVQAHDGDIRVESTEGEGSTFFADLPLIVPTVLVVDDEESIRALIRTYLMQEGAVVEEAENGRVAMDYINQNKAPHLVITDINMPEMDGLELLSTIKKRPELETVPVLVLTGSVAEGDRDRCLALGAADFTQKPIVLEDFMPRVRHFIG